MRTAIVTIVAVLLVGAVSATDALGQKKRAKSSGQLEDILRRVRREVYIDSDQAMTNAAQDVEVLLRLDCSVVNKVIKAIQALLSLIECPETPPSTDAPVVDTTIKPDTTPVPESSSSSSSIIIDESSSSYSWSSDSSSGVHVSGGGGFIGGSF